MKIKMKNKNKKKLKKKIEKNIIKIIDTDNEKDLTEIIKKDDKTYIHNHHDNSIMLLFYLYMLNDREGHIKEENTKIENLLNRITKISEKNKNFYNHLIDYYKNGE